MTTSKLISELKEKFNILPGGNNLFVLAEPQIKRLIKESLKKKYSGNDIEDLIQSAVAPLYTGLRKLDLHQQQHLANCTDTTSALIILINCLSGMWGLQLKPETRDQYITKMSRLLPAETNLCLSVGNQRTTNVRKSYEKTSNQFRTTIARNRSEYKIITERLEEETDNEIIDDVQEFVKISKATKSRYEIYPYMIWANPMISTPGVLKPFEIAVTLAHIKSLPPARRARARLALLGGIGCGWTKQLEKMQIGIPTGQRPEIMMDKSGTIWSYPWLPEWRPKWLVNDKKRTEKFLTIHRLSRTEYPLEIHPNVKHAIIEAVSFADDGHIFPDDTYKTAINDISNALASQCPGAGPIRPGRLLFTFHGLGNSFGYRWDHRYGITGRPMGAHTMAATYTSSLTNEMMESHWSYINWLQVEIKPFLKALNVDNEKIDIPFQKATTTSFISSWSMPKIDVLIQLFDFFQKESFSSSNPDQRHNGRTTLAMAAGAISLTLRPPNVSEPEISLNQPLSGPGFAQKVKTRPGETSTWVERRIPPFLRQLWWDVLSTGQKLSPDHTPRPMLIKNGKAIPFVLQDALNHAANAIKLPGQIRDYGLRHAGRTLLCDCGLSDPDLALVMNHWAHGFPRTGYARLGADEFKNFEDRYFITTYKLAKLLRWEIEKWQ